MSVTPYTVTGERAKQMRVVPATVLKRLYMRSNKFGMIQTLSHFFLLVAGSMMIFKTMGTWWLALALLLQACFVNSLFGAMHESVHYGAFRFRPLNDVLAFLAGAAILNNAGFYRHYHLAHHRYTQDPARDPELITSGSPRSWGSYLLRISALPFLALRARDIFLFPFGYKGDVDYIHPSAWPEVRKWGRLLLAFYAALLGGSLALHSTVLLWTWLIPLAIGMPLLRLYLVCEHTLCPNSDDGFGNTRTTISNPIVRFLMWNLPFHAEHHLFPNIAFYRLPEAHQYLRPHLKHVAKGYLQVNAEIIKSFS